MHTCMSLGTSIKSITRYVGKKKVRVRAAPLDLVELNHANSTNYTH